MIIGIDGGGTKTALVLADSEGRVLSEIRGSGTNIADIGLEECENRLRQQLSLLLKDYGGLSSEIDSIYAGIAGSSVKATREALKSILTCLLPNASVVDNHSDAFNPLYGEAEEGIVLIAGTGSSSFVVTKDGLTQVGGWGYLIDDAGSGFRIGADALKAAYRSFDGRGIKTLLEECISTKLGMPLNEAIPQIYQKGKSFIAAFTPVVFDAMANGDDIARGIITDNATAIAEHLQACLRHISARPATAIVNGGLTSNEEYLSIIKAALGSDLTDIVIIRPEQPPVYGALVKAARIADIQVTQEFRKNFQESYKGV